MKPDLPPKTWPDLLEMRKPSLSSAVMFGLGAAVFLFLAYFTGRLWFLVLFAASFTAGALELQRWLRRRRKSRLLVTRHYSDRDYQALGITPPRMKERSKSQKAIGWFVFIANLAGMIFTHTAEGAALDASSIIGAALPLLMILLDYNEARFTWGEIKGQRFRLAVYCLSLALFLYHVLDFLGLFSIQHLLPAHMPEVQFGAELFLGVMFFPLLLINICFTIRDSYRRMNEQPL